MPGVRAAVSEEAGVMGTNWLSAFVTQFPPTVIPCGECRPKKFKRLGTMEAVEVCIPNCGVVSSLEGATSRFPEEETRKENPACAGVAFELTSTD